MAHLSSQVSFRGCSRFRSVSGALTRAVAPGGPYYCSGGSEDTALLNCMNPNMVMKPPSPSSLGEAFITQPKLQSCASRVFSCI